MESKRAGGVEDVGGEEGFAMQFEEEEFEEDKTFNG